MSLQAKILNLLSGISDPGIRMEVSKTIMFLFNVYRSGVASEDDIKSDLVEICTTVIAEKEPTLSPEEIKKKAEKMAQEILNAFKLESITRRAMTKYGL